MSGVLLKEKTETQMHIDKDSHVNIDIRVSEKTVNPGTPRIAGDHQVVGKRHRTDVLLQVLPFSRKNRLCQYLDFRLLSSRTVGE